MNPKFAIVWLALIPIVENGLGQEFGLAKPVGLQYHSIETGPIAGHLDSQSIEYLGLVEEQLLEIAEIRKKYGQLAKEIKNSNGMAYKGQVYDENLAKLSELSKLLNDELQGVLLPHQKELSIGLTTYRLVQQERLVYSMIDGVIAQRIGLTNSERRAVKEAAREAFKEYKNEIERSHHKAIDRLFDSFPVDKRNGLKDLLEPMLFKGDGGLFAENTDYHFNTDVFDRVEAYRKKSPATDDE